MPDSTPHPRCADETTSVPHHRPRLRLAAIRLAVFHVWRATDLMGFPARIVPVTNAAFLMLDLSGIRLEPPSPKNFQPPEGFVKYDSAEAMMNELMAREHNLKRKTRDMPGGMGFGGQNGYRSRITP